MELDNTEAIKCVVALGLGVAIVPSSAISASDTPIAVRPLKPALIRTLGLIHRRDKPGNPAFDIVRRALATLAEPLKTAAEGKRRLPHGLAFDVVPSFAGVIFFGGTEAPPPDSSVIVFASAKHPFSFSVYIATHAPPACPGRQVQI